jgi:hypothetical protein
MRLLALLLLLTGCSFDPSALGTLNAELTPRCGWAITQASEPLPVLRAGLCWSAIGEGCALLLPGSDACEVDPVRVLPADISGIVEVHRFGSDGTDCLTRQVKCPR